MLIFYKSIPPKTPLPDGRYNTAALNQSSKPMKNRARDTESLVSIELLVLRSAPLQNPWHGHWPPVFCREQGGDIAGTADGMSSPEWPGYGCPEVPFTG